MKEKASFDVQMEGWTQNKEKQTLGRKRAVRLSLSY